MRLPHTPRARRIAAGTVLGVASLTAVGVVVGPTASQADSIVAATTLRTADGTTIGTVVFTVTGDKTRVRARVRSADTLGPGNTFHGFHIHANSDPANGTGCAADPAQPSDTWFTSADGHLADTGQTHGAHHGDLPSLLVNDDGTAELSFTTGRLELDDLAHRALMVHAGPDNFGNVPVGTDDEQYTANSKAATDKTAATGNAGDRLACGLISVLDDGGAGRGR